MLTEKHIKHFVEKGKSFFDKYISYTTNPLGIPSVIKVKRFEKSTLDPVTYPYVSFCVTQSVERHYVSLNIAKLLESHMYLPQKDCHQIAEYIVQKKYEQYIDFVMSS
tara:strand:- start:2180 stop:2503 length:324 start_codon:yes stop_codon:yes gene_type:complete